MKTVKLSSLALGDTFTYVFGKPNAFTCKVELILPVGNVVFGKEIDCNNPMMQFSGNQLVTVQA